MSTTSLGPTTSLADPASAVREQPGEEIGSGDAGSEFGLGMKARVLKEQSQALAGHLARGEGQEKTRNDYRSLKELIDDTEELAQRSELEESAGQ